MFGGHSLEVYSLFWKETEELLIWEGDKKEWREGKLRLECNVWENNKSKKKRAMQFSKITKYKTFPPETFMCSCAKR